MPDSRKYLHPESIARISRLELRAHRVVEGFLSGIHRSPRFGQSVEFLQHRQYVPGDDLRHVDWKVWAKQDRFYVKQFEDDTNMPVTMLVDVSASMQYGSGPLSKYDYGCTAAASLAYLLLRQQDMVGCVAFDQSIRFQVPQRSKKNHLEAITQALVTGAPSEKTEFYPILRKVAEEIPRRGMTILISDLLADTDGLFRGLKLLRKRGHDIMVLHVLDDDEIDFPFNGPTRFEGLESASALSCNPRALRDGYLDAMADFLKRVRRGCTSNACDYDLIRTSQPLSAVLAAYLHRRMGMQRRS
ncbi:MAG: DUF58 domain-containing protein [Pirellulales bacterium]|nr:DUF58 domain-containing protein [Pirellulales bacterium]